MLHPVDVSNMHLLILLYKGSEHIIRVLYKECSDEEDGPDQ